MTRTHQIINNNHVCEYGFHSFVLSDCMRGFVEYWPSVILRKMFIVCIAKYIAIFKDIIKIRYYKKWKLFQKLGVQPMPYDIQRSMVVILRNIEECFLFGFVTPMIIPLAALVNFWEMVCIFFF